MPERTDHNEAMRLAELIGGRAGEILMQQAERIAELEKEIADLHTTMFAAAVEIQEHWDAHCDAEGYGPANLMHRLERGIASQYGYDAKTLQRIEAECDQLRAEVERMDFIEKEFGDVLLLELAKDLPRADMPFREAIAAARTTHKDQA